MSEISLTSLQASVRDKIAFDTLEQFYLICHNLLSFFEETHLTRIVSPTQSNYIFYQYDENHDYKITRPLNSSLFVESSLEFKAMFERFRLFLNDLKQSQGTLNYKNAYHESGEINKVVYTLQQAIGCIGDSFDNPNQARKRIGQLFENLIRIIFREVGLECKSRNINIPIPGFPGYKMPYEIDLVLSSDEVILDNTTEFIYPTELVGSIKTTSKDRIDKIFLDKFLLSKLLGKDITVIAIFLHDVQRATKGDNLFGINSTFKTNHFLGYTVALNKLDGVYYVDPRPEMLTNQKLREQISDFQQFLVNDLWTFLRR